MRLLQVFILLVAMVIPSLTMAQEQIAERFTRELVDARDAQSLSSLISNDVDVAYLMTKALGEHVNKMDAAQLRRFADAFKGVLVQQVQVLSEQARGSRFRSVQQQSSPNGVIVTGEVRSPGGSFEVQLLIRPDSQTGRDKVADLMLEGYWASGYLTGVVQQVFEASGGDPEQAILAIEAAASPL